jgi:Ca2+-binding RTX toxin-like protein
VASSAYLSLDQGMIMAAIGNALGGDVLRDAFAGREIERGLRPVIGVEEFNSSPRPCTISGTEGDDRLRGTNRDDVVCGLGGDDEIDGRGGNDAVFGDAGDDRIAGGSGDDTLYGGEGADELAGGDGRDVASGGPGADAFTGDGHDHYEPGD